MTDGLKIQDCTGSVADVVGRLRDALQERRIEVFAVIDHAAGARGAGLTLRDEVLIVFGNPAVGTPLMQADPTTGIELPLRMLVFDTDSGVRLAWRPPSRLADRFELGTQNEVLRRLDDVMEGLAAAVR
ncbi:MAG TPA: DUF302 domain-containing protein [Amnibacterium sp.]